MDHCRDENHNSTTAVVTGPGKTSSGCSCDSGSYPEENPLHHSTLALNGAGHNDDDDNTEELQTHPPCGHSIESNTTLKQDLGNLYAHFNTAYEGEVAGLEASGSDGDLAERKVLLYSRWVHDLREQNRALINSLEGIELENERRIHSLQFKMAKSKQLVDLHMRMLGEYESQVQELLNRKREDESLRLQLLSWMKLAEGKSAKTEYKLRSSEQEADALFSLLLRIRDGGCWDTSGLELSNAARERIFGAYPTLEGSGVQWKVFRRDSSQLDRCGADCPTEPSLQKQPSPQSGREPPLSPTIKADEVREATGEGSPLSPTAEAKDSILLCEIGVQRLRIDQLEREIESKDVEISMQRRTISYLQEALVDLKRATGMVGRVLDV